MFRDDAALLGRLPCALVFGAGIRGLPGLALGNAEQRKQTSLSFLSIDFDLIIENV